MRIYQIFDPCMDSWVKCINVTWLDDEILTRLSLTYVKQLAPVLLQAADITLMHSHADRIHHAAKRGDVVPHCQQNLDKFLVTWPRLHMHYHELHALPMLRHHASQDFEFMLPDRLSGIFANRFHEIVHVLGEYQRKIYRVYCDVIQDPVVSCAKYIVILKHEQDSHKQVLYWMREQGVQHHRNSSVKTAVLLMHEQDFQVLLMFHAKSIHCWLDMQTVPDFFETVKQHYQEYMAP